MSLMAQAPSSAVIDRRAGRVDEALRLSEERFALAMKGANDGLWDRNLLTDEVYYSPRWKSMLGYAEHEVQHTLAAFDRLVHPKDRISRLEKLAAYMSG
ncbi:MAG TPA: PAS domain-containing protein, partial [Vicinamibacterales bacterium]